MFGGVKINTIFANVLIIKNLFIMSKKLNYQTIELYGVKLTLGYTEEGRRISDNPTDRHDVTIHTITAYDSNVDLTPLLENYIETIYELLNDKL